MDGTNVNKDLELKESDTRYVIEGLITNEPGVCKVYLSQTKPFYENNRLLKTWFHRIVPVVFPQSIPANLS